MIDTGLYAFVMKTLKYLKKDWEWAPILIPLLERKNGMEQVIVELSKVLNEAIKNTKDTTTRKKLQNAYMRLQEFNKIELDEGLKVQEEASKLISLLD